MWDMLPCLETIPLERSIAIQMNSKGRRRQYKGAEEQMDEIQGH
jgi:hypothetical protein